jgi:hypothetical protein
VRAERPECHRDEPCKSTNQQERAIHGGDCTADFAVSSGRWICSPSDRFGALARGSTFLGQAVPAWESAAGSPPNSLTLERRRWCANPATRWRSERRGVCSSGWSPQCGPVSSPCSHRSRFARNIPARRRVRRLRGDHPASTRDACQAVQRQGS